MLSAKWQDILAAGDPRLFVTVTFDPNGGPVHEGAGEHPAERPGALRFANDIGLTVTDSYGRQLNFDPWVATFPVVDRQWVPWERRAEVTETEVSLLADSGLADTVVANGSEIAGTARIDLFSVGMSISEGIMLTAGRAIAKAQRRDGPVSIRITDGDVDRTVLFPPSFIEPDEFAEVTSAVAGVGRRQVILGTYDNPVKCPQIGPDRCYLQEPPGRLPPTSFWIQRAPLSGQDHPVVRVARTPNGVEYDELVFGRDLADIVGSDDPPEVWAAGGSGQVERHPALFLLETVGKYALTPRARAVLAATPFKFASLLNRSADVLEVVRDQVLAQTDQVLIWRGSAVDVIPAEPPVLGRVGLGQGLTALLASPLLSAPEPKHIRNHFRVAVGLKTTGDKQGPLLTLYRTPTSGPVDVRRLLAASVSRFKASVTMDVPCPDLEVVKLPNGALHSPSADRTADLYARLYSSGGRVLSYRAEWLEAMSRPVGTAWELYDEGERLNGERAIVVGQRIESPAPVLTFYVPFEVPAAVVPPARVMFGPTV